MNLAFKANWAAFTNGKSEEENNKNEQTNKQNNLN